MPTHFHYGERQEIDFLSMLEWQETRCAYCKSFFRLGPKPRVPATIDHRVPVWRGGSRTEYENLRACCNACNVRKGSMTDAEFLYFMTEYGESFTKRVKDYIDELRCDLVQYARSRGEPDPVVIIDLINFPDLKLAMRGQAQRRERRSAIRNAKRKRRLQRYIDDAKSLAFALGEG